MTPDAFWSAEMQNRRMQQEQQQYDQQALMQGLGMFADAYKQKEQDKSDAKIYGNLMKVIAPAFGQNGDAILQEYNSYKNDRDKANYGRTMLGSLGAISNMMMAQRNAGIREQAPFNNAMLQDAKNRAAGNKTFSGGANAPVEPPLPPDEDQAGSFSQSGSAVPGGNASLERLNRDRAKRGLPPIK